MTIAWLSAITALVAVVTAPLISFYIVKQQTGASVLSANRQVWINTLRDSLSDYIGLMTTFNVGRSENLITHPEALLKLERILAIESKIKLLLNPKEDDHKQLTRLLDKGRKCVFADTAATWKPEEWNTIYQELFPLAQSILKREWERVKKVN